MKLRFSWQEQDGELQPACESDTSSSDGDSLLCCLLTDTGGLPYLSTLPWIDEGLLRIDAIRRGQAESLSWGREDWGALLRRDGTQIHSLDDEQVAEAIPLEDLDAALRAWKEFLQTAPDPNTPKTVLLSK